MAKMFYSLEEAAERLKMSNDQVTELVSSGKLQEFRDRDRLVFKKDQVDMLAEPHGSEDSGLIPLADSNLGGSALGGSGLGGSGLGLSLEDSSSGGSGLGGGGGGARSGSGIQMDEPKDRSGIAIFDTDATEEGDPSAVTRVTEGGFGGAGAGELTLDNVGSGSGLLDLTREGDDTSLGADLLQDVYNEPGEGAGAVSSDTQGGSGLFESTPAASDVSSSGSVPMVMAAAEPYDGTWSGITGGLALGAAVVAAFSLAAVVFGLIGGGENPIVGLVSSNLMMWLGIMAGVVVVPAVIGLVLGRRTG